MTNPARSVRPPLRFAARRDPAEVTTPDPSNADVLRAIRDELRELRGDVASLLARKTTRVSHLTVADRAKLAELLAAIAESWGANREFSVAELQQFASALATRRALRDALAAVGSDPRRVGLFLRRVAGVPANGFILERIGADRGAALWSVRELRGT